MAFFISKGMDTSSYQCYLCRVLYWLCSGVLAFADNCPWSGIYYRARQCCPFLSMTWSQSGLCCDCKWWVRGLEKNWQWPKLSTCNHFSKWTIKHFPANNWFTKYQNKVPKLMFLMDDTSKISISMTFLEINLHTCGAHYHTICSFFSLENKSIFSRKRRMKECIWWLSCK